MADRSSSWCEFFCLLSTHASRNSSWGSSRIGSKLPSTHHDFYLDKYNLKHYQIRTAAFHTLTSHRHKRRCQVPDRGEPVSPIVSPARRTKNRTAPKIAELHPAARNSAPLRSVQINTSKWGTPGWIWHTEKLHSAISFQKGLSAG